jgi:hypothetical protein
VTSRAYFDFVTHGGLGEIRSYLTTARSHGRHPLAAIRDALTGNTWMPHQA